MDFFTTFNERYQNSGDSLIEYPHYWETTRKIEKIIDEFKDIEAGTRLYDRIESIMGRVMLKRSAGKNLYFYTLDIDGHLFQLMSDKNSYNNQDDFAKIHNMISRGDIIGARGYIAKTKKGELSIVPGEVKLLTPCFEHIPTSHFGIEEKDTRYNNRYLDLIVNSQNRDIFINRHKIIHFIRNYLVDRDFIEVETPILWNQASGATAKPFKTFHNALKTEMSMRIAPELFLKQCVIGGLNRVFEIGKQFRNEDMDTTHLPEFTSIELYEAGIDYTHLMTMTEDLLEKLSMFVCGSTEIEWLGQKLSLKAPYPKLDMMDTLEEQIKLYLNDNDFILPDINSEMATEEYMKLVIKCKVDIAKPHTLNRLVDGLVGHFVEPLCVQPTFLINHPQIMSPLAKQHRNDKNKTERFELFINKKEFCNAYTELNNPIKQKELFEKISQQKNAGDDEIPPSDEHFVKALSYGLPPTGGWGMGIDRLVMLLTNNDAIREVVLFPPHH